MHTKLDVIFQEITKIAGGFADNKYIGLIGIILSILSIFYAWYTQTFRAEKKEERRLMLIADSKNIIRNTISLFPKLTIKYNNNELDSLTITDIIITNTGSKTIENKDIAPNSPLILKTGESEIIDIKVDADHNNPSNPSLSEFDEGYRINFDFLEEDDNFMIQILHTSLDSSGFSVSGKIIDQNNIRFRHLDVSYKEEYSKYNPWIKFLARYFVFINAFISLVLGFLLPLCIGLFIENFYIKYLLFALSIYGLIKTFIKFNKTKKAVNINPDFIDDIEDFATQRMLSEAMILKGLKFKMYSKKTP